MFCKQCGTQNVSGELFCKNCGFILETVNQQQPNYQSQQFVAHQPQGQPYAQSNMNTNVNEQQRIYNNQNINNSQNNYENINSNYVQNAVDPNMKKWAILSIVVPIVGIIWYWFIGLTSYLAILIAVAGFEFAQKGEIANKKLAILGKILNGLLCGIAIIMLFL